MDGPHSEPRRLKVDYVRVLLVDDNEDSAFTLGRLLGSAGHYVRVAANGEEALTLAVDFQPEIALLDIRLPNMDGYEVARRLRQIPNGNRIRIIAISGVIPDAGLDGAAGIDHHLLKPVHLHVILDAMRATPVTQSMEFSKSMGGQRK